MVANTSLSYGKGTYTLPSSTPDLQQRGVELRGWFETYLARPLTDFPRPPQVALEVMALSQKPNARIEDIASVLEREPLLAGKVLKLANSALYSAAVPCVTLKQALIRMGLMTVRNVVMEAAMQMTVIHAEGLNETLESIRRHSSAVAWVSRFVARNTPLDAENAFLLGLVHEVGLSLALVSLADFCRSKRQPAQLDELSWLAAEETHERFGRAVLESWGLPPVITNVIDHHHSLRSQGRIHPQVAVLTIAEHIASEAGWGVRPAITGHRNLPLNVFRETTSMDVTDDALQGLSLTRTHFQMVQADARKVLDTLKGHFKAK